MGTPTDIMVSASTLMLEASRPASKNDQSIYRFMRVQVSRQVVDNSFKYIEQS